MKLLFLGDFLYDYENIQDEIYYLNEFFLKNNYYTILNLEASLKSKEKGKKKLYSLANSTIVFEILKLLRVKAVNIANNHIMDNGLAGFIEIIKGLQENNIGYFGAGMSIKEAIKPYILHVGNKKIALCGFGWNTEDCEYSSYSKPGVSPLKRSIIIKVINEIRRIDALPIINLHWGYEYEEYPLPIHRKLAHSLILSGAELVIGHHPHVIQAMETFSEKKIYYSLGNFYFGSWRKKYLVHKNQFARENGNIGLGLLWDIMKDGYKEIFFENVGEKIEFKNKFAIKDISQIEMGDYNSLYKDRRERRFLSKRPSLYVGTINELINPFKVIFTNIKWHLINTIFNFLKILNLFDLFKKIYTK